MALVFDPHPLAVLRPGAEPARLSTFEDRVHWLRSAGATDVERLDPASGLLTMEPGDFVDWVLARYAPARWVEGPDFRFGRGRAGDVAMLAGLLSQRGVTLDVIDHCAVALSDQQVVACRSSTARELLARGRVFDAAAVLGRWHTLAGEVVMGDRRGRTIGFPTANLRTPIMAPGPGVYAAWATLPGGRVLPAAVNVGPRPTFDRPATVEAHVILGGRGAGAARWSDIGPADEYGWQLRLELVSWLRETLPFAGVNQLREQLGRDCRRAADLLAAMGPSGLPVDPLVESSPLARGQL